MAWWKLTIIKNLNVGVFSLLGALVLGLGLLTTFTVVGSRPVPKASEEVDRGLASIQPQFAEDRQIKRFKFLVETIDLGCLPNKKTKAITVRGKRVRFKGGACNQSALGQLKMVTNDTNGINGTPFSIPGGKGFSTDYISFDEGKNLLKLEFEKKDSEPTVHELQIVRLAVAEK